MASQFFNELDNLSDHSQVIVLGATNREDLLDPALMRAGRLDYVLPFSLPDERDRLEIFQVHTTEKPLGEDVDLTELADSTEGMVGSQIAFICRSATMMAISELIKSAQKKPSTELLNHLPGTFTGGRGKSTEKGGVSDMLKAVIKKRAYEDIVKQIRNLIEKGKLKRGDQLPTERELSETFKVSRATVREAILSLETMKLVDRRQGNGTYVIASSEEALVQPSGCVSLSREG